MNFPKRTSEHIKEEISRRIFSNLRPVEWVERDLTNRDYGVDCTVDISINGLVIPWTIVFQLKYRKDPSCKVYLKNLDYMNNQPLPTFLFVCNEQEYYLEIVNSPNKSSIRCPVNDRQAFKIFVLLNSFAFFTSDTIVTSCLMIAKNNQILRDYLSDRDLLSFGNFVQNVFQSWQRYNDLSLVMLNIYCPEQLNQYLNILNEMRKTNYTIAYIHIHTMKMIEFVLGYNYRFSDYYNIPIDIYNYLENELLWVKNISIELLNNSAFSIRDIASPNGYSTPIKLQLMNP